MIEVEGKDLCYLRVGAVLSSTRYKVKAIIGEYEVETIKVRIFWVAKGILM